MVGIHGFCLGHIAGAAGAVAEAGVTECEHVEAVDTVHVIETSVPHLKVGKAHGEVVHHHLVVEMLLAVINQAVEARTGTGLVAESAEGHAGIEYLVGFGIVVVHGGSGFGGAFGGFQETVAGILLVAESAVAYTRQIMEIVVLGIDKLALAEVRRIDKALLEEG